MPNVYVRTGEVVDGRTITLDEVLPMNGGRVRVIVDPVGLEDPVHLSRVADEIWKRHHDNPDLAWTREELDIYIRNAKGY